MLHSVVIIDDSDFQRFITEKMVKRSLSDEQVLSFNSAVCALAHLGLLEANSEPFPDVIFLDIHMPQMNGFDFLDKYLEFPLNVREPCKVVMLSSTDAVADHERIADYPVIYQFLSKPMSPRMADEASILWGNGK